MQPPSVRPSLAATVGRLDPRQGYLHKWPFASIPLAAAQIKWDPPLDSYWLERRRGFLHSVCRSVRSATPITLTFKSLGSDGARARQRAERKHWSSQRCCTEPRLRLHKQTNRLIFHASYSLHKQRQRSVLFGLHTPHLGIKNECGPQSNSTVWLMERQFCKQDQQI